MNRIYLCIDLKSFYASVECMELGLDPLTTNLVVADESRTEKTICLAVTPSLKSYSIPGRARLFEVIQKVKYVNQQRKFKAPNRTFTAKSSNSIELNNNPALELDYIIAKPRMALYMEYSTRIYEIYLKYVSNEDILVYSIDEVFMDITGYLNASGKTPREFAMTIIRDVLKQTGITATAGIGTNMYLAKIAMDITAKKMQPDKYGVRIAELDEMGYRRQLWEHRPLTDFWRVGKGSSKRLEDNRMFTMGDIARASTTSYGRKTLKKLFGINAKMLVDHAWGYEPCTIKEKLCNHYYSYRNKIDSYGKSCLEYGEICLGLVPKIKEENEKKKKKELERYTEEFKHYSSVGDDFMKNIVQKNIDYLFVDNIQDKPIIDTVVNNMIQIFEEENKLSDAAAVCDWAIEYYSTYFLNTRFEFMTDKKTEVFKKKKEKIERLKMQ